MPNDETSTKGEEEPIAEEGLTSIESGPLKIREIFKVPREMMVLEELKFIGAARIVAVNISNELYENFIDMNPEYAKLLYLHQGTLKFSEEYTAFGNESECHEGAASYFFQLNNTFATNVAGYNANRKFTPAAGNFKESNAGNSTIPDFRVKLKRKRNAFLIGEIHYSRSLRDGHERADSYFVFDDVRAVIVVNIRYPWNLTEDETRYDEAGGNLLFLYYSRGGDRDPTSNERIPDRVISFGNTPLTEDEIDRVVEVTHIPIDRIEGVGIVPGLVCDEETKNNPTFIHEVPSDVLLLVNPEDEVTLTNHPLNAVPQDLRLTINLYDLKQSIIDGIEDMNTAIGFNDHQIPNFSSYRL